MRESTIFGIIKLMVLSCCETDQDFQNTYQNK